MRDDEDPGGRGGRRRRSRWAVGGAAADQERARENGETGGNGSHKTKQRRQRSKTEGLSGRRRDSRPAGRCHANAAPTGPFVQLRSLRCFVCEIRCLACTPITPTRNAPTTRSRRLRAQSSPPDARQTSAATVRTAGRSCRASQRSVPSAWPASQAESRARPPRAGPTLTTKRTTAKCRKFISTSGLMSDACAI